MPFRDVVSRGDASPSAGMFLSYDRVFPGGATEAELLRIVRPRPGLPFTPIVLGDRPRLLWTTFTPHQIDLDVHDPAARVYLSRVLLRLAECGVSMVRLDAVGYTVKTGRDLLLPHAGDLRLRRRARRRGPRARPRGARRGARAPPVRDRGRSARRPGLRLRARAAGAAHRVHRRRRPAAALADHAAAQRRHGARHARRHRHDRRGRRLLDARRRSRPSWTRSRTTAAERASSAGSRGASTRSAARPTTRWAATTGATCWPRLLQLFTPGIPQVYYVGLLAGHNVPFTGDAREINRRRYTSEDLVVALQQPVVATLLELVRLRNSHPAFTGTFHVPDVGPGKLGLSWRHGSATAELRVALPAASWRATFCAEGSTRIVTDVDVLSG